MRHGLCLMIIFLATYPTGRVFASIQTDNERTQEQRANAKFLQGLSSIQEWAAKLEAALRSQGSNIDQRKAKDQLLPGVIAIQKGLSALEDINTRVVEDAGFNVETLNRDKMRADLGLLRSKISEIQQSFRDLRERVQIISIPEITGIERVGEGAVESRGLVVYDALSILGYGDDRGDKVYIDYVALKVRSDRITTLLHQAQDAFGKLHRYLES